MVFSILTKEWTEGFIAAIGKEGDNPESQSKAIHGDNPEGPRPMGDEKSRLSMSEKRYGGSRLVVLLK